MDIYLPKENLAFEYQGQGHFHDLYSLGHRWRQRNLDQNKRELCRREGITLIEVPFWWDFSTSSLVTTIQEKRKDLLREHVGGEAIPSELSLVGAGGKMMWFLILTKHY